MKIVHVIPSLAMGGAETFAINLAAAQKSLGHETAICCVMSPPEKGVLFKRAQDFNIPCYYSYSKHEPRVMSTIRLVSLIRHIAPDVVQSHSPRANSCTTVAARLGGVKCIAATFHNSFIWANKRQQKWGRWTSHWQDVIFCDAEFIRKQLIKKCPIAQRKARVVYPGIFMPEQLVLPEEKKLFREQWGIRENEKLVGIVARLADVKDHNTFIDAAEIVSRANQHVKFLIVGDGPRKDDLGKMIHQKILGDRIILTGYIPRLDSIWGILDIFVLTSLSEGFPLSIIGALAAGTPVIATNVGGIPEIIKHGENGFLVAPRQIDDIAYHITTLLNNPLMMKQMQTNARATANSFQIENAAMKLIDCYKEFTR